MMALPTFVLMTKVGQAFNYIFFEKKKDAVSILNALTQSLIMKRMTVFSTLLILFSITTFIIITKTNDHKECHRKTEFSYGTHGEKIISEIHVCKEKYNL